ncbi:MAG: hypothetical protein HC889_16130 [Synechococcaceae cyanobacterium SM1_2_3]|nr:hypothetical protein [Synechococcaceae cyanobacterium SM1_2_3]
MMDDGLPPGIGHNQPPPPDLKGRLELTHSGVIKRATDLLAEAAKVPDKLDTEDDAKTATDLASLAKACSKELERNRVNEKEPFLTAERVVDAIFVTPRDKLVNMAKVLERRLTVFLQAKAAAEKAAREAEAERERQAAQDRFNDAVSAQRVATAAKLNAAKMADAERIAKLDLDAAGRAFQDARNALAAAQQLRADAETAGNAIAFQAATNDVEQAMAAAELARGRFHELRNAQTEATRQTDAAKAKALAEAREAEQAQQQAEAQANVVRAAERDAEASPAELSRTRSSFGMAGLRSAWKCNDWKRAELDLEALRQHLPADGIEQAIRSWIRANKDGLNEGTATLAGVSIINEATTVVR